MYLSASFFPKPRCTLVPSWRSLTTQVSDAEARRVMKWNTSTWCESKSLSRWNRAEPALLTSVQGPHVNAPLHFPSRFHRLLSSQFCLFKFIDSHCYLRVFSFMILKNKSCYLSLGNRRWKDACSLSSLCKSAVVTKLWLLLVCVIYFFLRYFKLFADLFLLYRFFVHIYSQLCI